MQSTPAPADLPQAVELPSPSGIAWGQPQAEPTWTASDLSVDTLGFVMRESSGAELDVCVGRVKLFPPGRSVQTLSVTCRLHPKCSRLYSHVQRQRDGLGDGQAEALRWLAAGKWLQVTDAFDHMGLPKPLQAGG